LALGCPLNNLTQELAGVDEEFREVLDGILRVWRDGIADAFAKGRRRDTCAPMGCPSGARRSSSARIILADHRGSFRRP
jgi:hypothetical protein